MPYLLKRLPIPSADATAFVPGEAIRIYAYEVVVWVSLTARDVLDPSRLPRFPALLDTGHTHNFSIQEEHLVRWAGLHPEALPLGRGSVRYQGRRYPLRGAQLWLHGNQPGYWDRVANRPPYRLRVPEGILVYPAGSHFPRLPLIGLRAVVRNGLRLTVDGKRGLAWLGTGPWWWPFG
jgi:hypothetical protein